MKKEIKISALTIDEGDESIHYQLEVTNGINSITQDFYGYSDSFQHFATGLISFPKTLSDKVKLEIGESGTRWAYYILLDVFCYENNGHSAIHIVIDNNGEPPHTNKSEFYIQTIPASLNKLGQLLLSWNPIIQKELSWAPE